MLKHFNRNSWAFFVNMEKNLYLEREREREGERETETTDDNIARSNKILFVCRVTRARMQTPSSHLTLIALIR